MISIVVSQRPRTVTVDKVATAPGLAEGLNEAFSNPQVFLELLILHD